MLTNGNHWCVLTTHKENYSLLSAFVAFYRQRFGMGNFLMFCGRPGARTHSSLKEMFTEKLPVRAVRDQICHTAKQRELAVTEFAGEGFTLWVVSYAAADFTTEVDFHELKVELHQWADTFLSASITRTLAPDCDEFLHVKEPRRLETLEELGFHFVDVVPSEVWPPTELNFSLQGWYYRRQAQPRFKFGGRLALVLAKMAGRGLNHSGCKTFYFDRARLKNYTVAHHGVVRGLDGCCAADRHFDEPGRAGELLRDTACGYHLAMTCREHYMAERLRLFSRVQTDMKKRPVQDEARSPETLDQQRALKSFDRYISKSIFPTFTDNALLSFLPRH